MAKWTLITRSFRIQSTLLYAHSPLARISCMSTSTTASTTSGGSDSSGSTTTRKATARKAATTALRSLSPPQMAQESARISSHLHNTGLIHAAAAKRIAIYIHCPKLREVDTTAVLQEAMALGSRIYAPRVQDKDANMHFLHINSLEELEEVAPFGIREPGSTYPTTNIPREDINEIDAPLDLVIMPGLAFTRSGKRLGRGGGYYDKFIATCLARSSLHGWCPPLFVALAFRVQMVEDVPCDAHDQLVDIIVTPDEVVYCSDRGKSTRDGQDDDQTM